MLDPQPVVCFVAADDRHLVAGGQPVGDRVVRTRTRAHVGVPVDDRGRVLRRLRGARGRLRGFRAVGNVAGRQLQDGQRDDQTGKTSRHGRGCSSKAPPNPDFKGGWQYATNID